MENDICDVGKTEMRVVKVLNQDGSTKEVKEVSDGYELQSNEQEGKPEDWKQDQEKKLKEGFEKTAENKIIDEKKSKNKQEAIRTSLYIDYENELMAEQVFNGTDNQFVIYRVEDGKEKINYYREIDVGVCYKPHIGEEISKKAILLPTKPEEYDTDEKLDQEIKDYINKWLDVPSDVLQFAVWNIKRSWVYERFHTLNYLRALGDTGQGKSRFLDTLGYIHYKPIATSGASTAAPVFRIIDKWHGTLIMDEADFQNSDEAQDIIKIINQGYEKGRYVMRCDMENKNNVNFFDPFCPKILATRKTFEDKAVESRCITQVMVGTKRRDIKWNLNKDFWDTTEKLRNKLLMWRFRNFFKIDPDVEIDLDLGELEPRVQQIVGSFVSLFANNQNHLDQFREYILNYQGELIEERKNSFAGTVVNGIHLLLEGGEKEISAKDIIQKAQITNKTGHLITPRGLSSTLKALGFKKPQIKRVDGVSKRCIPLEMEHVNHLFKRYGVTVVTVYKERRKSEEQLVMTKTAPLHNNRNNRNSVTEKEPKNEPSFPVETNQNFTEKIHTIIKYISEKKDIIPIEDIVRMANKAHIKEKDTEEAIEHLLGDGDIFEPKSGFLKVLD